MWKKNTCLDSQFLACNASATLVSPVALSIFRSLYVLMRQERGTRMEEVITFVFEFVEELKARTSLDNPILPTLSISPYLRTDRVGSYREEMQANPSQQAMHVLEGGSLPCIAFLLMYSSRNPLVKASKKLSNILSSRKLSSLSSPGPGRSRTST